jgi:hypothetical protein
LEPFESMRADLYAATVVRRQFWATGREGAGGIPGSWAGAILRFFEELEAGEEEDDEPGSAGF